jgi:hypothetical protein
MAEPTTPYTCSGSVGWGVTPHSVTPIFIFISDNPCGNAAASIILSPTCRVKSLAAGTRCDEELMNKTHDIRFSELVGRQLSSEEARTLWTPMAQELDRVDGGPDAAKEYLDAERQRLEERVENLLARVKEQLGR